MLKSAAIFILFLQLSLAAGAQAVKDSLVKPYVYQNLTRNYGKLKLPMVFTNHMVMQRGKAIPVYGTANANEHLKITFRNKSLNTVANRYGQWKVWFKDMPAGGPYELKIQSNDTTIHFTDVLIGDVWLCSGQSNMAFPLHAAATGKAELKNLKPHHLLRLLKFNTIAETDNTAWDAATLQNVNQLNYFSGQWAQSDAKAVSGFSAVGYYFGKKLVREQNIPIGLIEMAVGGSTIESWIDRYTMEHEEQLVDLLTNWRTSDLTQDWVRGRADVNLKNAANARQRHPYEPTYNYEAGISKLTAFTIKGVIWYQGESNAQNPEQYQHNFPVLVSSWRKKWGYNFPFYYVQLSGINRPSWPYFRNMQRKLQSIVPNSGMAVSSDLGDSLNVHPVKKQEVGERLALLALKHTYHKPVTSSGPVAVSAVHRQNEIIVSFTSARQLLTANTQALTGFELVNSKGIHIMASATIHNKEVHLAIPKGETIKTVLYAWQPFTRANLVNEAGLPASTFSVPIN